MLRFLVDANLPRSLAPFLVSLGLSAEDVRDLGFRPDQEIILQPIELSGQSYRGVHAAFEQIVPEIEAAAMEL